MRGADDAPAQASAPLTEKAMNAAGRSRRRRRAADDAAACARRRRRPPHPRAAVALPAPSRAIASPPQATREEARAQLNGIDFRPTRARRDDARRERLRVRALAARANPLRPDPHADGARRGRGPRRAASRPASTIIWRSPSSRANCRCASPPSCGARSQRRRPRRHCRERALRPVPVPVRTRRAAARRTSSCGSPSASATCCNLLARTPGETGAARGAGRRGSLASNERTVDVQINRLRRKIEGDPANPRYLQTARGAGYRLVVDRLGTTP